MSTLHEYFLRDGGSNLTLDNKDEIRGADGEPLLEVTSRIHMDFEARARYVSVYLPSTDKVSCPSRVVLSSLDEILKERGVKVMGGHVADGQTSSDDLQFTGRIFIYSEDPISEEDREYIDTKMKQMGHDVRFRLREYAEGRSKFEKQVAFISHDARDAKEIAQPLAIKLSALGFPVWFDEFQLKVGDSLRESIEAGLKECPKCIFLLTPNFLENGGWAKREYDSVFTRELIERRNVILPVWSNVSKEDVYAYSPILADRVAVDWSHGIDAVASKLIASLS